MFAVRQIVSVMLQQRNQYDVPLWPLRRQSASQTVERRGAAGSSEKGGVLNRIGLNELHHLLVRPGIGVIDDAGGKMRLTVGVGVVQQQLVGNLPGAAHRERGSGGVEIMAAGDSTIS